MGAQLRREALQKKNAWEGFLGRLIVIWAGCVIGLGGEGESPASMSGRMCLISRLYSHPRLFSQFPTKFRSKLNTIL